MSTSRNYSLRLGKKLINLYKGSGISCSTCVKIRTQSYITLPGGFQLPIAVVVEQYNHYEELQTVRMNPVEPQWINNFAQEYLQTQMVAGQIINRNVHVYTTDNLTVFQGAYDCLEMIGRQRNGEVVQGNGKSN